MSLRGQLVLECARPKCHGELVLGNLDVDLEPRRRGGIDLQIYAPDWRLDEDGSLVCPQCAEENPREKHEDDGQEYGHPADRLEGRE